MIIWVCLLPFLYSFNFSPMTQTIKLDSGNSATTYQIENNTNQTIPVTIKAVERIQKIDGKESLPPTNQISVFPPQLIIPSGEKKTIRVDWKGKKKFKVEKSFRIIAEQVPLDLENKKQSNSGGIKMLLKYMNALYVNPGNTESKLRIQDYKIKDKLEVIISNDGSKHQYLKGVKITFKDGDKKIQVAASELKVLDGQNILAKTQRLFSFKRPKGIKANLKASISFEK